MPPGRFCRVGEPLKYAMFGRGTFPVSAGRPAGRRGHRRFRRMAVPKSISLPDVKTPQEILLRRFRFMGTLSLTLSGESDRDEREHLFEHRLPVAPGVAAVAHAVLQGNSLFAHRFEEVDVPEGQEVVVAAVHPPADGALCGGLFVAEVADQLDGGVLLHRAAEGVLLGIAVRLEQRTHRAGR